MNASEKPRKFISRFYVDPPPKTFSKVQEKKEMTKKGYTHINRSERTPPTLKDLAQTQGVSIARLIQNLPTVLIPALIP